MLLDQNRYLEEKKYGKLIRNDKEFKTQGSRKVVTYLTVQFDLLEKSKTGFSSAVKVKFKRGHKSRSFCFETSDTNRRVKWYANRIGW